MSRSQVPRAWDKGEVPLPLLQGNFLHKDELPVLFQGKDELPVLFQGKDEVRQKISGVKMSMNTRFKHWT